MTMFGIVDWEKHIGAIHKEILHQGGSQKQTYAYRRGGSEVNADVHKMGDF